MRKTPIGFNLPDKPLLGYQFYDGSGNLQHGEEGPFEDFPTFMVLGPAMAAHYAAENPGYILKKVFEGDIENPRVESGWLEMTYIDVRVKLMWKLLRQSRKNH